MTKKSYAKVNVFLKIAGKRDKYHLLVSRFARVKNLYDTISFIEGEYDCFTLEGKFGCTTQQNTIYKAYLTLNNISSTVSKYFKTHKVTVDKVIPEFAGLGGGSSNCATFMLMVNAVCNLGLSKDELSSIGVKIGADVPFFIYEYDSANVRGIGEIVEEFKEEPLDIQVYTPNIQCNTSAIFTSFRDKFYKEISKMQANKLLSMNTKDILRVLSIEEANDLYLPALDNYIELKRIEEIKNSKSKTKYYFTGSGSSFFKLNDLK